MGPGGMASARAQSLEQLFRPPTDLMVDGDYDSVRQLAKAQGRYLLVNIQSSSEFDCHRLNRDTWSNATLKEVVQSAFVFWMVRAVREGGGRRAVVQSAFVFWMVRAVREGGGRRAVVQSALVLYVVDAVREGGGRRAVLWVVGAG